MCCGGCGWLREEFRLNRVCLDHSDPSLFVKPQCCKPVLYVFWAVFWAVFHFTMLMLEIHYQSHLDAKWFIYISNTTYLLQGIFVLWDCGVTLYVHLRRKDIRDGSATKMTWYLQVQWVLFNISINGSIMVTIIYYVLLDPVFHHSSINKHLINTIYTILLLTFSAKPVRLLHCYHTMIYAGLYTAFSVIYQKAAGEAVYDAFDWDKAGSTGIRIVVFILVCIPVVQVVCFAYYKVRMCIWRGCCRHQEEYNVEVELESKTRPEVGGTHGDL